MKTSADCSSYSLGLVEHELADAVAGQRGQADVERIQLHVQAPAVHGEGRVELSGVVLVLVVQEEPRASSREVV